MPYDNTMRTDFNDGLMVDEGDLDPMVANIGWLRNNFVIARSKPTDETISSNAGFHDDNDLQANIEANTNYLLEYEAVYGSATTPGFRQQFVGPVGIGGSCAGTHSNFPPTAGFHGIGITSVLNWGGGGDRWVRLFARLTVGTNAGILKLQWGQQVSTASNTILYAGSYLKLTVCP